MSDEQSQTIKPKRRLFAKFFLFFFCLCVAAVGWAIYDFQRFLETPAETEDRLIIFTVEPGSSFVKVAEDLKAQGALTDVLRFRVLGYYKQSLGSLKAGDFQINTGWTPEKVLEQLLFGQQYMKKLVLREGLTWWQVAKAVEEQGFARYDDFVAVIHDPEFLAAHAIPFANAEGFLFPDTYMLRPPKQLDKAQARVVASLLVRTFWKKNRPLWLRLEKRTEAASQDFGKSVAALALEDGAALPALPDLYMFASLASTEDGATKTQTKNAQKDDTTVLQQEENGENNTARSSSKNASIANQSISMPQQEENTTTSTGVGATSATQSQLESYQAACKEQVSGQGNGTSTPVTQDDHVPLNTGAATSNSSGQPSVLAGKKSAIAKEKAALGINFYPDPTTRLDFSGPLSPAEVSPQSLLHLITLASLVEKETGVPAERPRVAGVYANRLRKGMLLQCDPTIIYGIGPNFIGPIKRSQIQDANNTYNTYQNPGLPPGPICSSGLDAMLSALRPEKHEYLYFVATGQGPDHTFSRTLQEHNRAVSVYRSRIR